jgi:hypothetical protein
MSLARIITRLPEASRHLAEQLRARGFEVETRALREDSAPPTDLEIQLEECDVEDALQRASLEAGPHGCVFIGPGAIAQDFRPIAVIPLIPNMVAEAVVKEKSVPEKPPTSEEPAWEQPVDHSHAASISDLAAQPQTGESASEANLEADATPVAEAPVLLETQAILATGTSSAEAPSPTHEAHVHEVHLPAVHLEVPPHDKQLVYAQAIADPTAQPESPQPGSPQSGPLQSGLPTAPGTPITEVAEAIPVVCEQHRDEPDAAVAAAVERQPPQPIPPALAHRFNARKVRVSFPRLHRTVYYWGAAVLAAVIAVEALVLIFAGPALPGAGKLQNFGQQGPRPQVQNAATAAIKAGHIGKVASEHRSVRTADEGYVAKNTVIRYGSRPGTPPAAKSPAKPRSSEN